MTDLLGSILGSMEKPPIIENKEKKKALEQKALMEKLQQQDKEKLKKFRVLIQKRISDFVKDGNLQKYKFETMNKVYRTLVHEVAEVAGLTSFSFGEEDVDRYVILWKKEFAPSDEELTALRNNEEWDPEKSRIKAAEKEEEAKHITPKRKHHDPPPPADYHQKYEHLIGKESAKDAARATSANKSYGFVPSENKRDQRTIEQVMAESRARKRQKLDDIAASAETHDKPEPHE